METTIQKLIAHRPNGPKEAFLRANRLKRLSSTAAARWHWARIARQIAQKGR